MAEVGINENEKTLIRVLTSLRYDLNQDIISCGLVPSLKNLSVTKVISELLFREIRDKFDQYFPDSPLVKTKLKDSLDVIGKNVLKKSTDLTKPVYSIDELKPKVDLIKENIKEFFTNFDKFFFASYVEVKTFKIYWDSICWTQEVKINYKKSVSKLVEDANLSIKDKYILACNYCIEKKIQELHKNLPDDFITDLIENNNVEYTEEDVNSYKAEPFNLVMFWTFNLRGENERFLKIVKESSLNEYLLKWAIFNEKYGAIQYIWDIFLEEETKEKIVKLISFIYSHKIILYLFEKMIHQNKLENIYCWNIRFYLVKTLNRVSKYCDVDLVPNYVLEFMRSHNFEDTLNFIRFCWFKGYIKFEMWKSFALYFEREIKMNLEYIWNDNLFDLFVVKKDMKITKFFFGFGTNEERKEFLYSDSCIGICDYLVYNRKLDCIDTFLHCILDSEEQISHFKNMFKFHETFMETCCQLIVRYELTIFEETLNKFFLEKDQSKFRKDLPYINNAFMVHKLLLCTGDYLNILNKFFNWCFEGNEKEITRCKAIIFDLETDLENDQRRLFFNIVDEIIEKGEWDLVVEYWKWIFFATEDKIDTTSKKLARVKKIIDYSSLNKNDDELLKRFIMSSCFEPTEVSEIKEELKGSSELISIVKKLLKLEKFLEIDNLFKWCYSSDNDDMQLSLIRE